MKNHLLGYEYTLSWCGNYRRSGVTDAMRIPKDPFYAHQVMWDGWVDIENPVFISLVIGTIKKMW
ncbi:hypothetical protein [Phocaeicola dorei]|uniref:hypothetical protein n=1 Tax=Phocaeicola dorei TaxID=357276 RepID=UPI00397B4537